MKTIHEIRFSYYVEDIVSERRTLFHMPIDDQSWTVGDELRLLDPPRCKIGTLIDVRQVRLLAELNVDLAKLNAPEHAYYIARWDRLHPNLPSATDPVVWRIEFRYGAAGASNDPPEWSLAS